MWTVSKYLLAATLAVAFVASADAQGQRRGGGAGGQPPGGRGQGFGGGFGGGAGLTTLMVNKSVLEEIKATDEQKEKLAKWAPEAQTKQREAMQEFFGGGGGQPDFAKIQEANAKIAKEQLEEVSKVLKEEQVKRVKQIQVQIQSVNAFRQKEVQDALKLTDEQKETIREIQMSLGQEMRELGGFGGGGGGGRPSPEAMAERTKKVNELNKKFLEKIVAQLKDDQKKAWEDLNGKPFEYKPEAPMRRRDN
jgi:hypothetical protein